MNNDGTMPMMNLHQKNLSANFTHKRENSLKVGSKYLSIVITISITEIQFFIFWDLFLAFILSKDILTYLLLFHDQSNNLIGM